MASIAQIDLNTLVLFVAVAESGGFTAAAERLGVTKAKVSIQVGRLEALLGSALFTRTTRQVNLTEAGRALLAQCRPLLHGLQEALEHAGESQAGLTGTLRISTTVDHAIQSLAPAIAQFAKLYPLLQIDLRTGDRVADMVGEGIDLSVRMGWLRDSSMRAVKLGEFQQYAVASPEYLQRAGMPEHPADLSEREWIALSLLPTPLTWKFSAQDGSVQSVQVKSRIRVDSTGALRAILRQGSGISILDEFSAQDQLRSGHLVQLLKDWSLPPGGIYAVYPPGPHVPAKVRTFIDFYRKYLAGTQPSANLFS